MKLFNNFGYQTGKIKLITSRGGISRNGRPREDAKRALLAVQAGQQTLSLSLSLSLSGQQSTASVSAVPAQWLAINYE